MNPRIRLLLALVCCLSGCFLSRESLRSSIGVLSREPGEHSPGTYVAFGDLRGAAGFSPEFTPQQQQQYREEARQAYLKAIQLDPKYVPAYVALAKLQQQSGDHEACCASYTQALQIEPKDASLWHDLGLCQCRLKRWTEAVASFQKAVELNPHNRQFRLSLGFTLVFANRVPEAIAILTPLQGQATAHYNIARLLQHTQQNAQALHHARLASQLDPKLAGVQELLAELSGKPSSAIQTVAHQQLVKHKPTNPQGSTTQNRGASAELSLPVLMPAEQPLTTKQAEPSSKPRKSISLPPRPVLPASLIVD